MEKEEIRLRLEEARMAYLSANSKKNKLMLDVFNGNTFEFKRPVYMITKSDNWQTPHETYVKKVEVLYDENSYPFMLYTDVDGYQFVSNEVDGSWELDVVQEYLGYIKEPVLYDFPIDNKHLCEDFTDDFHHGQYTEHMDESKNIWQSFWRCGALCTLSYHYGMNWAKLEVLTGTKQQRNAALAEFEEIINGYREHLTVKVVKNEWIWILRFYKDEELW